MSKNILICIEKIFLGGIIGLFLGYILTLYILSIIFVPKIEIAGIVVLTSSIGIIYGLILGLLNYYSPKYVNKFCLTFASLGLITSSIPSMFLTKIEGVFIVGFPVLFGLIGSLIDKKHYKNPDKEKIKK